MPGLHLVIFSLPAIVKWPGSVVLHLVRVRIRVRVSAVRVRVRVGVWVWVRVGVRARIPRP